MTKTKKSIAIIILMLVLGCTLFGCIQTQATKVDYKTHDFFIGKYKYAQISRLDIAEDKVNPHSFLCVGDVARLTENRVYWPPELVKLNNASEYMEFDVDSVVIDDVLAFIEGFGEEIKITKNEMILDNGIKYKLEKGIYNDVMYSYDQLEMYFLDDEDVRLSYVVIGYYEYEHESPAQIDIKYRKYLTGSDGNPYMYNITISYVYI